MNRLLKIFAPLAILCSIFVLSSSTYGQSLDINQFESDSTQLILKVLEKNQSFGRININQDSRIDALLRKHIGYNDSVGIPGWKIMIYNGRDIKKAQDAGALFSSTFPDLDMIYVVDYQAPDFKTLIGAFRTREEAYRLHQQIITISEFEFSYLVHATLKSSELK